MQIHSLPMMIGSEIRTLRKKHRFTQKDLGDVIGCSPSRICQVELGKAELHPTEISKVADVLGTSYESLVTGLPKVLFEAAEAFSTVIRNGTHVMS